MNDATQEQQHDDHPLRTDDDPRVKRFARFVLDVGDRDNDGNVDVTISGNVLGREFPTFTQNIAMDSALSLVTYVWGIARKVLTPGAARIFSSLF